MNTLLQLLMKKKISRIKRKHQNNEQSKNQRSDTEKINLIEEGKKIGIDEVIKHNEIVNKSLKSQI